MGNDVNRTRVKRNLLAEFLDLSTTATPDFKRIGAGVSTGTPELNPQTEDIHDLDMQNAMTINNSYKPTMTIDYQETDGTKDEDLDPVNEWLCDAARKHVIEKKTTLLRVHLNKEIEPKVFLAYKVPATVYTNSGLGGDAGAAISGSATLNYAGDQTEGTVTFEDGVPTFVANDE